MLCNLHMAIQAYQVQRHGAKLQVDNDVMQNVFFEQ
jgi:hypothetical protein